MAMTEASTAHQFLKKNPGSLKILPKPLRLLSGGASVGVGEIALKDLLNTTIESLHTSGFIKRSFDKYTSAPGEALFPDITTHP